MANETEAGWWRRARVARHYGVDPSTITRWSRGRRDFPKPVQLGNGTTAWNVEQVREYDRNLIGA